MLNHQDIQVEVQEDQVYFLARAKDKSGRQVRERLPALEFVRRWTLHILPQGFTKARYYGGWSNTRRVSYQRQCERLQPSPPTVVDLPQPSTADGEMPDDCEPTCPHCGQRMVLESDVRRPSWREFFYGPEHPRWVEWRGSG